MVVSELVEHRDDGMPLAQYEYEVNNLSPGYNRMSVQDGSLKVHNS